MIVMIDRHTDKQTYQSYFICDVQNQNYLNMKRVLWIFTLSALMTFTYGQKSIDKLFDKYAGNDGFVTVTLKGNLLKFIRSQVDQKDKNHLPLIISEIRLLVQENRSVKSENFFDIAMKDINVNDYEEFMRIKEHDQDLRMLVRAEGDVIREFLMIGGGEDNLIIQIKGKMTFEEAENICSDAGKDHGSGILSELN